MFGLFDGMNWAQIVYVVGIFIVGVAALIAFATEAVDTPEADASFLFIPVLAVIVGVAWPLVIGAVVVVCALFALTHGAAWLGRRIRARWRWRA